MKKCYYLVSTSEAELLNELKEVGESYDVIAWGAENYQSNEIDDIILMLKKIGEVTENELIFAYREINGIPSNYLEDDKYVELMKSVIDQRLASIIEVSMFKGEEVVSTLVNYAKEAEVQVMLSVYTHDVTPTSEQIQIRYQAMQRLGADIGYQSFHISSELDYLTIWTAMSKFRVWKANNRFVANLYGFDEDFVESGTMKQGSEWLVTDRNLLVK